MRKAPPDDSTIETCLSGIRPQPGSGFYQRMSAAPWTLPPAVASPQTVPRQSWIRVLASGGRAALGRLGQPLTSGIALLLLAAAILFVTPLRTTAENLFNFFLRADSDRITVASSVAFPDSLDFSLSLAEAQELAGFPVKTAVQLPADFEFHAAAYDARRQAVILEYLSSLPGTLLRISQMNAGRDSLNFGSVGASADVRQVMLHPDSGPPVMGEYVAGAWIAPPLLPALETAQPYITGTMQASWDPQASVHMIRWLSEGILYEVIHGDMNMEAPNAEALILLAESMK